MGRSASYSRSRSRSKGRDRSGGRGGGGGRASREEIQRLVDERQEARKERDFDKADRMRQELHDMSVMVDDTRGQWRGPDGMTGEVAGNFVGIQRREGDWDCPECGKLVFANKDTCYSCGASKPRGGSDRYYRDRDDRDRRRRDRSEDDYDRGRRRRDRDDYEDRGRRRDRDDDDGGRSRRRRDRS
eukprot:gnl/TRDRNA2_/TRDRNA2_29193_c0_seq1.p1 gnl/TRDRNA2_/TRDRNA2_29193_c0~~gnl/TRDRNA2_/TRDRNA2_29193_c0_seq1.p1  ORF type:complete len:186 (-),score=29.95 gnl/TRDRNA2_/TRDRNA2_29193_c0_seq1:135-692(-)